MASYTDILRALSCLSSPEGKHQFEFKYHECAFHCHVLLRINALKVTMCEDTDWDLRQFLNSLQFDYHNRGHSQNQDKIALTL